LYIQTKEIHGKFTQNIPLFSALGGISFSFSTMLSIHGLYH
jgi:hypothetical protein